MQGSESEKQGRKSAKQGSESALENCYTFWALVGQKSGIGRKGPHPLPLS